MIIPAILTGLRKKPEKVVFWGGEGATEIAATNLVHDLFWPQ
jgi:hypothetical protein